MPSFSIENTISTLLHKHVIVGVDEVGYGAIAGPVVSAAVFFPIRNNITQEIRDSKKLTPQKREDLFLEIIKYAQYGIGFASVSEINQYNILNATHLSMKRALLNMNIKIDFVLVDGNRTPNLPWEIKAIVNGDNISTSIAAASIIAKITRDKFMKALHTKYPHYYWNKNCGYGTKTHISSLHKYGKTTYHRNTFMPVSQITRIYTET
ncbi:ribonuclease HII [Neoehrlichia mikurensis]|uniref:Ribonuclease HII n=1 Tax=Neoehrlichia mikurensis TaxID=89586 RepID=A0A9Q9F340_9RICK|nr:ribonuclease HII [Neoehrlichia mikurensis]QXK92165.1 ribonuclease HII [Neoehrlichia mikurensis]QXK92620.1 ribonuclease HII [Neoehrlichia mikurensis]QXK93859.1 ribonuclease HII [Neoehrlichia mikurensis]UTO55145.1 ribonuclease HII [Neoehrlichia mikurensis]UTO56066.1 ribonuclease HII [Neoehrlichia mikurensis]